MEPKRKLRTFGQMKAELERKIKATQDSVKQLETLNRKLSKAAENLFG